MRMIMACLALPFMVAALPAACLEVTTQWLETNTIAIQAGDALRVVGDPAFPLARVDHVDWQGGSLELVGCRLEPLPGGDAARTPGLPLVAGPGQHLLLEDTWIQGVPQAVVLAGGKVEIRGSTLAATECNIQSVHPESHLTLRDVNLCASTTGLVLDSVDTVLIEGALFLTNGTGLRVGPGNQITLRNCLFQGNEYAIQIAPDAVPPVLADSVDLVDSRYAIIQNLSLQPIDLANAHLDDPSMIVGPWIRTGFDFGSPAHKLKAADNPVVIDDEDVWDSFVVLSNNKTVDGLPCVVSSCRLYGSNDPYSNFTLVRQYSGNSFRITNMYEFRFYMATSLVGEWEN